MNNIFNKKFTPCEILNGFYYRADFQPPSEIMKKGFLGTSNPDNCFANFDREIFFCSNSIHRIIAFKKNAKVYGIDLKYIYKINANGLRGYRVNEKTKLSSLSKIHYKPNLNKCKNLNTYHKHHSELIAYLSFKITRNIDSDFIFVRDVHIQGPIPVSRISYIINRFD